MAGCRAAQRSAGVDSRTPRVGGEAPPTSFPGKWDLCAVAWRARESLRGSAGCAGNRGTAAANLDFVAQPERAGAALDAPDQATLVARVAGGGTHCVARGRSGVRRVPAARVTHSSRCHFESERRDRESAAAPVSTHEQGTSSDADAEHGSVSTNSNTRNQAE